jgi:putative two-component system response regulator
VDDDALSREMLTHTLRAAGHDVVLADCGLEAMKQVRCRSIRMVISDVVMPGMSGVELCRQIRQTEDAYVYVILLTGRDDPDAVRDGMDAGADDFLTKPFNLPKLMLRLRAGERTLALETRDVALFALARLAESRDTETGMHLERVQHYSRALAREVASSSKYARQMDRELVRLIFSTSPLHDIGKVGIPDSILRKPGPLTVDEFRIMQTHVQLGTRTLDAALSRFPEARFLNVAREIAATHHEHWNGEGYPFGLQGEQIPLSGRIVALADVYDALTRERVYKSAFTHEDARQIIVDASGSQFDPEVVRMFLRCESEFIRICRRFRDLPVESDAPPAEERFAPVPVTERPAPWWLSSSWSTESHAAASDSSDAVLGTDLPLAAMMS